MSCKILSKDTISDKEFLELMIKHHNVAVKMSQLVMMTSQDDFVVDFARRTVFNQSNEVNLMEKLLKFIPNLQNEKSCSCGNSVISAHFEKSYPNIFNNLKCKESHFEKFTNSPVQLSETPTFEQLHLHSTNMENKPIDLAYIENNKISDKDYINHMMEHHKSGIDLAKLLIKSTKEPKLLVVGQTMLLDQEKELFMIKNLTGCLNNNWRQNKH
jgi:uncharacterized protein (DUF305 family)